MLIMLAAIDEGLAAGVFGIPADRMERVRELLEALPTTSTIVEVITLGFPAGDDASDRLSSRGTRPPQGSRRSRPLGKLAWRRGSGRERVSVSRALNLPLRERDPFAARPHGPAPTRVARRCSLLSQAPAPAVSTSRKAWAMTP